jgi:hypothetical protein
LLVSFTLGDVVHQIPSCCFRASRTQHPILQSREPQTVLKITSVGTQIMVYFFCRCAQLYFTKDPSKKMVINAAYLNLL